MRVGGVGMGISAACLIYNLVQMRSDSVVCGNGVGPILKCESWQVSKFTEIRWLKDLWPVYIVEHSEMRSFLLGLLASRSTPPSYKHAVWHKWKLLVCGLSNLTAPSDVLLSSLFSLCDKITTDSTEVKWNMSPLIFPNDKKADSVAFDTQNLRILLRGNHYSFVIL